MMMANYETKVKYITYYDPNSLNIVYYMNLNIHQNKQLKAYSRLFIFLLITILR